MRGAQEAVVLDVVTHHGGKEIVVVGTCGMSCSSTCSRDRFGKKGSPGICPDISDLSESCLLYTHRTVIVAGHNSHSTGIDALSNDLP